MRHVHFTSDTGGRYKMALDPPKVEADDAKPDTLVTCLKCGQQAIVSAAGGEFQCPCGHVTRREIGGRVWSPVSKR